MRLSGWGQEGVWTIYRSFSGVSVAYKRIGERLREAGLVTEEQLSIALEQQKKTGELLGAILFSLGFISQKDLFTVLSMMHDSAGQAKREAKDDASLPDDLQEIVRQSSAALSTFDRGAERQGDAGLGPVVRLVEKVISMGLQKGATDIHIGPDVQGTRIRYRIDGQLQHGMYLPKDVLPAIVSRVKIMGSMNIAENRVPQDGATEFAWNGRVLDLRVSSFPILGGENVVLRVLDKSRLLLGLENLGFYRKDIEQLNHSLQMPFGMVLVTGPTGSGKTTTLYSALSIINSVYKNIFTIEDPIEYQLPLVRQSQVNARAGLTFAAGLRSILRQDPDVLLVGEMRDLETAELAIRSALTGHLVFSTLHTNDAASSPTRLVDMGIEPFLIASTIDTIISQRLIRLLCSSCKEPASAPEGLDARAGFTVTDGASFFKPRGCRECNDTGYRGRTVIYEIMKLTESLKSLIMARSGSDVLAEAAKGTGMETMYQTGLRKAAEGLTSLEEVHSATRVPL